MSGYHRNKFEDWQKLTVDTLYDFIDAVEMSSGIDSDASGGEKDDSEEVNCETRIIKLEENSWKWIW